VYGGIYCVTSGVEDVVVADQLYPRTYASLSTRMSIANPACGAAKHPNPFHAGMARCGARSRAGHRRDPSVSPRTTMAHPEAHAIASQKCDQRPAEALFSRR